MVLLLLDQYRVSQIPLTFHCIQYSLFSSSSTLFMVDDNSFTSSSSIIRLYSFTGTVPSITKNVVSLNIQRTNVPPGALQPGTTIRLDTSDDRVEDAAWYQGKLWLAFDDACTPPGDTTVRACIRLDRARYNCKYSSSRF